MESCLLASRRPAWAKRFSRVFCTGSSVVDRRQSLVIDRLTLIHWRWHPFLSSNVLLINWHKRLVIQIDRDDHLSSVLSPLGLVFSAHAFSWLWDNALHTLSITFDVRCPRSCHSWHKTWQSHIEIKLFLQSFIVVNSLQLSWNNALFDFCTNTYCSFSVSPRPVLLSFEIFTNTCKWEHLGTERRVSHCPPQCISGRVRALLMGPTTMW